MLVHRRDGGGSRKPLRVQVKLSLGRKTYFEGFFFLPFFFALKWLGAVKWGLGPCSWRRILSSLVAISGCSLAMLFFSEGSFERS